MNTLDAPGKPAPPVSHRKVWWILAAVAVPIVGFIAFLLISELSRATKAVDNQRRIVQERIAALRAQRVLRPNLFEPAEEGNAWDLHTQALTAIGALSEEDIDVLQTFISGEAEANPEKVDRLLAAHRPHLEMIKAALHRPWVEPDYRYEQGTALKLPLASPSIQAAKLLAAAAKRCHERGRDEEAADYVLVGLGLADHMEVKAPLIGALTSNVCQWIALDQLKRILADHELPPAALERLARALERLDAARPDFQDCLRREDILARSTMRGLEERGEARQAATWRDLASDQVAAARFYGVQDRFMEGLERIAKRPAWERQEAGDKLVKEIIDTGSPLHLLLIPQVGRAWRNLWLSSANWAVARVAVAVAWHQAANGSAPADLKDLVPRYLSKVPDDPCAPGPIKGVVQAGTVTVYSLGFNRVDDGGKPPDLDLDDESGDILWTVKRRK